MYNALSYRRKDSQGKKNPSSIFHIFYDIGHQ